MKSVDNAGCLRKNPVIFFCLIIFIVSIACLHGAIFSNHVWAGDAPKDVRLIYETVDGGAGSYAVVKGIDKAWADDNIKGEYAVGIRIDIPDTHEGLPVTEISDGAFRSSSSAILAESYYVAELDCSDARNLKVIGEDAFYFCALLEKADFSGLAALKEIKTAAFNNCWSLKELDFSGCAALETVGETAFSFCDELISVDFTGAVSLKVIDDSAFSMCGMLSRITWGGIGSLESIGETAFFVARIASLDLSGLPALSRIGGFAFAGCPVLASVDLRAPQLETIGDCAFIECEALKTVRIGAVGNIGEDVFEDCPLELVITEGAAVYADYNTDGGAMSEYKTALTYEIEFSFVSSVGSFPAQAKLFNKPLRYEKSLNGEWAYNGSWQLPVAGQTKGKELSKWIFPDGTEISLDTPLAFDTCTAVWVKAPSRLEAWQIGLIAAGGILILASAAFAVYWLIIRKRARARRALCRDLSQEDNGAVPEVSLPDSLTAREREIAQLLLSGKKRKEIAQKLYISENTVKEHVTNVLHKSHCVNQLDFVLRYGSGK